MPREPKYKTSQMIAHNDGAEKGQVICRMCGYAWYPDPRKWKNLHSPNGYKLLYCPYCAVKNRIDKDKLREIVVRTETIVEMRKIGW